MIPQDPVILLSFVNTWLRDHEGGLAEFAATYDLPEAEMKNITDKLAAIGYRLSEETGQFSAV